MESKFNSHSYCVIGGRIAGGGNWLSVSQGLAEDASDLIFGFGNGLGDLAEHSNEYWDSDEYDDDDDVGYIRQPIEDEAWFLGHEVDYPTEQEKDTEHTQDKSQTKNEDDHSFAEEDSYFSGEQYVLAKGVEPVTTKEPDLVARYDGELMDATELSLMRAEPVWQGLVTHENDLVLSNKGRGDDNGGRFCSKDIRAEDDRNAAVRSIGVGISDDVDDNGCIAPDYFPGEGSEWDLELLPHRQVGAASVKPPPGKGANMQLKSFTNGGFSFPSPVPDGHISHDDSTNPVWSNPAVRNESYGPKGLTESNSMVGRNGEKVESSRSSSPSAVSHSSYTGREHCKEEDEEETSPAPEEDPGTSFEDEDAIVVQEQSITIQCLEALNFLHGLGLIHCDLKPENILIKSYSRCEIKVIDLGSSCFETDHLCSYVQSRSYRAPEVILGLPYDKKIDIWSLGCILAELCSGNVLFQNDSPATLLARVIGIIGSIDQQMLAKGPDTCKYFTKTYLLYERNQESNNLEYLIPKKSSLRRRLPMGDQGFIDFVAHLLQVDPKKRPSASEALKHPWLTHPYEPISP
ncbi:hypothetical protein F2Q69_00031312 [Brassica cretica]|uniref:Protein kinase domain-containing protein n=1 Tax=Brassica cretica TaxID=69181 RepID=A0A8S9RYE3_BRACR|nr:hypothetical protein F2Q69_00031312 [Brassica cretica]